MTASEFKVDHEASTAMELQYISTRMSIVNFDYRNERLKLTANLLLEFVCSHVYSQHAMH